MTTAILASLGGEEGCRHLADTFYSRVAGDPVLRPLFPGKSLRCATEEFGAFLIQFLGGDESQTQYRWWLSLRESHARFKISQAQRAAWLRHMMAVLEATPIDDVTRIALRQFFTGTSSYLTGQSAAALQTGELETRWQSQILLDDLIAALAAPDDSQALALAPHFASRPSVYVGILARMIQAGRPPLIRFACEAIRNDRSLSTRRSGGKTILHYACGAGCVEVVELLLHLGTDPNVEDRGEHPPLYCLANECASNAGPALVRMLVQAGADVNHCGGVTGATPLHMAARRGFVEIAQALLDCGAKLNARDRKGDTPLQRALNCRRPQVAQLLAGL